MNSHEVFIHIHQGCFAGTGAIVRLPQCQWSKPDGYGKISQCITTRKHSKAKTVCIFLGIYCIFHESMNFVIIGPVTYKCFITLCNQYFSQWPVACSALNRYLYQSDLLTYCGKNPPVTDGFSIQKSQRRRNDICIRGPLSINPWKCAEQRLPSAWSCADIRPAKCVEMRGTAAWVEIWLAEVDKIRQRLHV